MMLVAGLLAILVAMGLALARSFLGPRLYDRILAVNMFGTKTVLLIALVAFALDRPGFLDIALFYALVNFVATIAVLRLTHYDESQVAADHEDPGR